MGNNKTLIIFTTRTIFLPANQASENILFNQENTVSISLDNGNLDSFFKGNFPNDIKVLYRLKKNQDPSDNALIFAYQELPEEGNGSTQLKENFIISLFKDVVKHLSEEEKSSIEHIKFILHRFELDAKQYPFGSFEKPELLSDLNELKLFDKDLKNLEAYKAVPQNKIEIEFIAFAHERSNSIFYLLETGRRAFISNQNQIFEDYITHLIENEKKPFIEEEEKEQLDLGITDDQQKKLSEIFNEFDLNFFICSGTAQVDIKKYEHKEKPAVFSIIKNKIEEIKKNKPETPSKKQLLNIVFLPIRFLRAFLQPQIKFFETIIDTFHSEQNKNKYSAPILFIGCKDIMSENKEKELQETESPIILDPRYRFIDSSIWYRYAAVEKNFGQNLLDALYTFKWAYNFELYKKNVCKEYVELSNRLLKNSYLEDSFGGGHASWVFPFVFHSESFMASKAEKSYTCFTDKGYKWNFLLIDDYANWELKEGKQRLPGSNPVKCKGKLVEGLINSRDSSLRAITGADKNESKSIINENKIEVAEDVYKSIEIYFSKKTDITYDIILLDYLFSLNVRELHYGTKLLEEIERRQTENEPLWGKGILQNYWIYPATVFPEAMQSSFQEKSIQHLGKDWQLAKGADPLNTPHLFRSSLYEFMEMQVNKVFFSEQDIWNFMVAHPIPKEPEKDKKEVNLENYDWGKTVNKWALDTFRQFIERFSAIEGCPDNCGLGIAKKEHKNNTSSSYRLMSHFRQLLFILAYTTGFDFPIIEREFECIQKAFKKKKAEMNKDKAEKFLKEAQEFLFDLAKAVYRIDYKYF